MIGITMPDEGEVRLFGEPFHRGQLHRIGYLPEERGLYKRMKVLDHLVFLGACTIFPSRKRASVLWPGASACRLSEWTDKKVEELSKGMQQKIQFIAALLHDPALVIMDEPFSGLDPANCGHVEGHSDRAEESRQDHSLLHSPHGPGRAPLRCPSASSTTATRYLEGDLKKIKASYGKNHVQMQYEGDPGSGRLRAD